VERVCPAPRLATLQQARLFAPHGELLLWRDGEGCWEARLIRDARNDEATEWLEAFDEPQLLWGTHGEPLPHGFTFLQDGGQGLRHAVPLSLQLDTRSRDLPAPLLAHPCLLVRHYLTRDGFARVVASRLVNLQTVN
jgi:CRISPR-associated protein (TIGR03984 family)